LNWPPPFAVALLLAALAPVPVRAQAQQPSGEQAGQDVRSVTPTQPAEPTIVLTAHERAWLRAHPVIRVVQDPGWPPIEYADAQGRPIGITEDYVRLVEQRLGIRLERVCDLSWQEAYARLQRWDLDMTTSVTATPFRQGFWAFTKPYMSVRLVIVARENVTYVADMRDLAGQKVAVVEGYIASENIPHDFPEIQLVKVKSVKEGLDRLQRDEVFAMVDNMLVISHYMAQLHLANLKIVGETPYVNAQAMAVRKDWPIFTGILQKALDSISDAERAAIYQKWVPIRYEHGFDYRRFWQILGAFAVVVAFLVLWNRKLGWEIRSRQTAEAKLRTSEERFRAIAANTPDHILVQDRDLRYLLVVNPQLGLTQEDMLGRTDHDFLDPADAETLTRLKRSVLDTGQPVHVEVPLQARDGQPQCFEGTYVPQRGLKGQVDGLIGYFRNVTDRRRAEQALRESEARYRQLIEQAADGIFLLAPDGRFLLANTTTCRMLQYTEKELLRLNIADTYPPAQAPAAQRRLTQLRAGEGLRFERMMRRKDGTLFPIEVSANRLEDGRFQALVHDITERKHAEEERTRLQTQLTQAQKMESVGRLAGGVAHDFNNMLAVILGHVELALEHVDPTQPLHADLQYVQRAAQRSADLTRQLRAFARQQTVAPQVLDLNATVDAMLAMLRRLIGENIQLEWRPGADVAPVLIDPTQVDQILANLCVNARDAIAGIGQVTIETTNTSFDETYCAEHLECLPGDYVLLTVSDTGCGMDKETIARLFEPFFTTKDVGKGTGLGLATVYGIVKQNRGFVGVYSEPKRGTSFKIYLPRHGAPVLDAPPVTPAAENTHGHETILLVEDEPAILDLATRMLQHQGYTVLPADSPSEALRRARAHTGEIHLLMTDVVMPEMNGRDLADELLSGHPHLKRLFMSGYTADVIAHQGVLEPGVDFIQKPFSMKTLATRIRAVLDKDSAPAAPHPASQST